MSFFRASCFRRKYTFFLAAFPLLAVPATLLAQADGAPDAEIVVTATGAAQRLDEVGQAITVIDAVTIETRQTTAISDLLATTPGVTVTRAGGIGSQSAVRIRGAGSAQTLVLIDGVRVNDPSEPAGAFDFGALLAGSIDRIEVLRGPNAIAWGSQAIGGVVAVTTETPAGRPALRLSGEYGDYGTAQGTASASYGFGPVTARIGGSYVTTDGISALRSGTETDGFDQYGVNGRVGIALSDAVAIDIRGYFTRSKTAFDDGFALVDSNDVATARQLIGYAGLTAKTFGGRLSSRLAYSRARIDRSYTGSFDFDAHGVSDRVEYQGDARVSAAVRGIFGAEYEWTRLRTFDAFSGTDRRSTGIGSAYAQLLVEPFQGVHLTGGIRHDEHQTFGGKTTFGANGVWTTGSTTLRGSYAEGFKAPSLSQLYGFGGSTSLRPEQSQSFDIGIEQRLVGNSLRLGITYFERTSTNLIVNNPVTFELSNVARATANGAEVELTARPVPALTLVANYSYVRSINRSPGDANFGRDLELIPRQSFSSSLDWDAGLFAIGSTLILVGDSFNDKANQRPIDGHVTADVRASIKVGRRIELYGRVENLFDARYETVAGYGTLGRNAHVGVRVKI